MNEYLGDYYINEDGTVEITKTYKEICEENSENNIDDKN
jgi:hypothetical protein